MPIALENVGIAVRDLEATIAFFADLGLTVLGRDEVSGEWADTAVGLDGNGLTAGNGSDGNGDSHSINGGGTVATTGLVGLLLQSLLAERTAFAGGPG